MTTYFIAGYSDFPDNLGKWDFWRVVNWTDADTPQEAITKIVKGLEDDPNNIKYSSFTETQTVRGIVMITAFNKV